MPPRALISRASSCTAQNAYNPISALRAAFDEPHTVLKFFPGRQFPKNSRCRSFSPRSIRFLSTTIHSKDDPANELATNNVRQFLQNTPSQQHATSPGQGRERQGDAEQKTLIRRLPISSLQNRGRNSGVKVYGGGSIVEGDGQTAPEGSVGIESETQIDEDPAVAWQRKMLKMARVAGKLSKLPDHEHSQGPRVLQSRRASLSYQGEPIPPRRSPLSEPLLPPWAVDRSEVESLSGEEILTQEIERFGIYWELTPAERQARWAVINNAKNSISKFFGDRYRPVLSGSGVTGLSMITSDVDLRISNHERSSREDMEQRFTKLWNFLQNSQEFICVVMRLGQFPIITAQHLQTGLDVQIVAAPSTAAQQNITREYLKQLPHLRSLYRLLHTTLSMRGLVDVFNGGIGSYGLFLMIVASITRPSSTPAITLVEQLLRFLDFYSDFDTTKYGISVNPPKLYKKHDGYAIPDERPSTLNLIAAAHRRGDHVRAGQWAISQRRLYQPYLLSMQDPANATNDLGRKSNAIKHLFATIDSMRTTLRENLARGPDVYAQGNSNRFETLLTPLLGSCHEVYADRRRKLEVFGIQEQENYRLAREHGETDTQRDESQGGPEPEVAEGVVQAAGWAADKL